MRRRNGRVVVPIAIGSGGLKTNILSISYKDWRNGRVVVPIAIGSGGLKTNILSISYKDWRNGRVVECGGLENR